MDKKEQLKLICVVMSMATGMAWSFGMFHKPSPPHRPTVPTHRKTEELPLRTLSKDDRNDGGTISPTMASQLDSIS